MGAAADGFALVSDVQTVAPGSLERGLSPVVAGPILEVDPMRTLQVVTQDRRGVELLAAEEFEAAVNRVAMAARREAATLDDLQRTLRSSVFSGQLDQLRTNLNEELELDRSVTISVAGVSFGLSLVYVLWLIRGGVLMGSYLSALPAWRVLDPLPVLSRVDEEAEEDDEALDAVTDSSGNPLRSFG